MKLGTVGDTDQLQLWKFLKEIYLRITRRERLTLEPYIFVFFSKSRNPAYLQRFGECTLSNLETFQEHPRRKKFVDFSLRMNHILLLIDFCAGKTFAQ